MSKRHLVGVQTKAGQNVRQQVGGRQDVLYRTQPQVVGGSVDMPPRKARARHQHRKALRVVVTDEPSRRRVNTNV